MEQQELKENAHRIFIEQSEELQEIVKKITLLVCEAHRIGFYKCAKLVTGLLPEDDEQKE